MKRVDVTVLDVRPVEEYRAGHIRGALSVPLATLKRHVRGRDGRHGAQHLPAIAEREFHHAARAAILSFIVVFGVTKAPINCVAGRLSDALGGKLLFILGWIVASPVPFLLMWAPSWGWVLFANGLLGNSRALTWSTAVVMKLDLAGPKNRGMSMKFTTHKGCSASRAPFGAPIGRDGV